jgi:hypothetical protein
MSRRPSSPPRRRALVRLSQFSRSEQQALVRAYELALPVLRQPVAEKRSATDAQSVHTRRVFPQTRIGG